MTNIFDDGEGDLDDAASGGRGGYDGAGGAELFDADEMAGFIEDDTQSESSGRHGSSSDDEGDRAARKQAKKKARQAEKSRAKGKGRRAGFGAGFVEGITAEAWQEVTDVFGNGQDYAYALEEEGDDKGEKELKDVSWRSGSFLRRRVLTSSLFSPPPSLSPSLDITITIATR